MVNKKVEWIMIELIYLVGITRKCGDLFYRRVTRITNRQMSPDSTALQGHKDTKVALMKTIYKIINLIKSGFL